MLINIEGKPFSIQSQSEFKAILMQYPSLQHNIYFPLIESWADIVSTIKTFPDSREFLFQNLIVPVQMHAQFLSKIFHWKCTLENFPDHRGDIFELVLNKQNFAIKVQSLFDLRSAVELFPEYSEVLLQFLTSSSEIFNRIVTPCVGALSSLATIFLNQKQKIFELTLKEKDAFLRFVKSAGDLELVVKHFPENKELLYQMVITNHDIFRSFIMKSSEEYNLTVLCQIFNEHAQEIKQLYYGLLSQGQDAGKSTEFVDEFLSDQNSQVTKEMVTEFIAENETNAYVNDFLEETNLIADATEDLVNEFLEEAIIDFISDKPEPVNNRALPRIATIAKHLFYKNLDNVISNQNNESDSPNMENIIDNFRETKQFQQRFVRSCL
ncbi:MAG: hypothetical protein H0U71_00220 [Gammaproteobacteria bacterium]|nr:hypothetical protein [Gammaproteobacteria bacterium]